MSILRYISRARFSLIEYVAFVFAVALFDVDQWPWAIAVLFGGGMLSGLVRYIANRRAPTLTREEAA